VPLAAYMPSGQLLVLLVLLSSFSKPVTRCLPLCTAALAYLTPCQLMQYVLMGLTTLSVCCCCCCMHVVAALHALTSSALGYHHGSQLLQAGRLAATVLTVHTELPPCADSPVSQPCSCIQVLCRRYSRSDGSSVLCGPNAFGSLWPAAPGSLRQCCSSDSDLASGYQQGQRQWRRAGAAAAVKCDPGLGSYQQCHLCALQRGRGTVHSLDAW
jgi:hypothetical protein